LKEQGKKLMTMIGTAVNSLDRLEEIVPAVQDLGRRHVDYGVKNEDYAVVGEALIWTLGQGLGDDFTDDAKAAWIEVYTVLADTMIKAADDMAA
jgi:hemoglobin-like flavoprotein